MILLVCFRNFHYKKVNPNVESQSYATKIQPDFLEKENKDCSKSSKKKNYKLNGQSSSFPLSASSVTYPSKPIIGNFRSLFVFLIASSCSSERLRLGFVRLWTVLLRWCFGSVGPEAIRRLEAIFFETVETDFVRLWEFLCSATTLA